MWEGRGGILEFEFDVGRRCGAGLHKFVILEEWGHKPVDLSLQKRNS